MINQSPADRAIRGAAGLAFLATPLVGVTVPFFFLGLIPLATGIAGWCPLYRALGISTCRPDPYQHLREGLDIKQQSPSVAAHA